MLYNQYTPYKGGIQTIYVASHVSIPDSVEFSYNEHSVNVDFWIVQALRRAIPLDEFGNEQKIKFIKAVRRCYSLGLKEAKDACEWFMNNVDRSLEGQL